MIIPIIWQLAFSGASGLRKREEDRSHSVFCDLALEVTLHCLHDIHLVTLNRIVLFSVGGAARDAYTGGKAFEGPFGSWLS